ERWRHERVAKVVGIESRGFILAAPLAYALGAGFAIVRKPGKLPWRTIREIYELEYGERALELHIDAVVPGERVVVVDDVVGAGVANRSSAAAPTRPTIMARACTRSPAR